MAKCKKDIPESHLDFMKQIVVSTMDSKTIHTIVLLECNIVNLVDVNKIGFDIKDLHHVIYNFMADNNISITKRHDNIKMYERELEAIDALFKDEEAINVLDLLIADQSMHDENIIYSAMKYNGVSKFMSNAIAIYNLFIDTKKHYSEAYEDIWCEMLREHYPALDAMYIEITKAYHNRKGAINE